MSGGRFGDRAPSKAGPLSKTAQICEGSGWRGKLLPGSAVFDSLKVLLPLSGRRGGRVAGDTGDVHTPIMTLKNAALLALVGTILMTALLVWTFVFNILNALRGLIPAVTLFSSFIYAFGCFSVTGFFYVFHRAQS